MWIRLSGRSQYLVVCVAIDGISVSIVMSQIAEFIFCPMERFSTLSFKREQEGRFSFPLNLLRNVNKVNLYTQQNIFLICVCVLFHIVLTTMFLFSLWKQTLDKLNDSVCGWNIDESDQWLTQGSHVKFYSVIE